MACYNITFKKEILAEKTKGFPEITKYKLTNFPFEIF